MPTFASWPNGARLAMSFVVNVEEGAEMRVTDGDKGPEPVDELGVVLKAPVRNLANESNYRYGIRAGARRVFALFEHHRIPATVAVAATALERAPEIVALILGGSHEVAAHGWRWVHQFSLDIDTERDFIARAVEGITATTGTRPLGWLSRYVPSPNTRRLLAEAGFAYHMDDYSDDAPWWDVVDTANGARAIVVVPYALDSNDMKFWLAPGYTPAQWLDYAVSTLDQLLDEAKDQPKMMSLGLHLRIIGRPGRIGALHRFVSHVAAEKGIWCATRLQIARHFAHNVPPPKHGEALA